MLRQTLTEDRSDYHCETITLGTCPNTLTCDKSLSFDKANNAKFDVYLIGDLRDYGKSSNIDAAKLLGKIEHEESLTSLYKEISGSFVLVIVNRESKRISVVNDHLASIPLYYTETEKHRHISTSLPHLINETEGDRSYTVSSQAIFHYIYFHCIPSPITIYDEVFKLKPSELVVFDQEQTNHLGPQYKPEFSSKEISTGMHNACLSEIEKAVNLSLPNTSVAAFLSGGLDSSTVAGMLKKISGRAKTFSIGFNEQGYDETEFAEISARHFGTEHVTSYLEPEYISENFALVASGFDEPFGNSSALAAFFCATKAKQSNIETLLAGDGGDEFFAGNSRYAKQKWFYPYEKSPEVIKSILRAVLDNSLIKKLPLVKKASSYIHQADNPLPDRLQTYNFLHRFSPTEVFTAAFLKDVDRELPLKQLRERYTEINSESATDKMLYMDWKFTLADNDLIKVRKMCQLAGIEVKFPLTEKELVDFSCTIPAEVKLPGQRLREFFKKSTENFLAPETLTKPKHGFGLPFGRWMRTNQELVEITQKSFAGIKSRNIFRPEFLDKALRMQSENHAAYYGELIWVISVLEIWLQSREQ
ncbi:MAG: asparagine synthase [Cellvibrionaceae bacterium]|nr:asparagine synthase [Cellvibrionaceae bacterium]|tara:strand:+ start:15824 stop:17590 length:1767 start_codon:yes stop_codon:yes gene_type:complete